MVRFASLMRCAITRRRPITLISSVAAAGAAGRAAGTGFGPLRSGVGCVRRATYASRSFGTIRPFGPEPATCRRSTPASCARRRIAGEVATRMLPEAVDAAEGAAPPLAPAGVARAPEEAWLAATAEAAGDFGGTAPPAIPAAEAGAAAEETPAPASAGFALAAGAPDAAPAASVSSTMSSAPTE